MKSDAQKPFPSPLVRSLRDEIASAISGFSANDVPYLCARLGLSPGDRDESFKSKYKYAERRLLEKNPNQLIDIAHSLIEEVDSFDLVESTYKLEESQSHSISELTRRRIVNLLDEGPLSTELSNLELIRRIWPTYQMQSIYFDSSEGRTLDDDLFNLQASNKELLETLDILHCSQRQFFRFLEEITSPIAQNATTQLRIVDEMNKQLVHDGFHLTSKGKFSGSDFYEVIPIIVGSPSDRDISIILSAFDIDTVHTRWQQALDRRESDPEGAITLARTLLEDVCKWIITEADEEYLEKDDLPALYKKLAKVINLAPDNHTEAIFRQILGSCQSVVESLGALRNKISDAHSRGPKRAKPAPRHAQLAVNLAGTMATFLVSTWETKKQKEDQG